MTRAARRIAPFATIAVALTLAACGGGDTPPPDTSTGAEASSATETAPEALDKPEQQQVDAEQAKAALPKATDLTGSGWADSTLISNGKATYDPAVCADVELDSKEARAVKDEDRTVREEARYQRDHNGDLEITLTSIDSHDQPYPLSILDAAGQHVTDCASYTWTRDGSPSNRRVEAISTPQLGDRSFGLRLSSEGGDSYVDRLYVRSGHNLITVMVSTHSERYDGALMTKYAQDILDRLKKTP